MRARLFLLCCAVVLMSTLACSGKKKGPYLAPEPVPMAATAHR